MQSLKSLKATLPCLVLSAILYLPLPALATDPASGQPSPGRISGDVVDRTGTAVAGARVRLSSRDASTDQEVLAGNDGQFSFANVVPGPFQVTVTAPGFAAQASSGSLVAGEVLNLPRMVLAVATFKTDVEVTLTQVELAEEQIKTQEKQRLIGVLPNFYVTYLKDPAPLTPKQKFELAWKSTVDPVAFGINAIIAGVQQAQNDFSGYGQGAQGYAKRYGAGYADFFAGTMISGAILPSLLKQDPRYFYKGTGSAGSRILYALANSIITKGDNGRWQPGYSNIIGSLATGGISNLYYPASSRNGLGLTFENALIGIGEAAAGNLLQEFLFRKLTPSAPHDGPGKP